MPQVLAWWANFKSNGKYGAYLDIPPTEAANHRIFYLRWEQVKQEMMKTNQMIKFSDLKTVSFCMRYWYDSLATNPYLLRMRLTGAQLSPSQIELLASPI